MMAPGGAPSPTGGAGTPVPGFTPVPSAHGSAAPGAPAPVAATPSIPPSLVGTVLADRYRVLKKLGEGGMGSVYLAEHTTINKKLAIKVLSSEYSHKQDLVDRFLQEARAASMIEQENVVEITDFGSTPGGSVFFVMEFLNGEDLSKTIKKNGPLSWARVKPIMLQICTALSAAHDAGIIHRDMKPENCYRIKRGGGEDFIKVLDFGIAKVTTEDGEGGKGLTRTGMIFGTPEYMSPEQAKGEKVDHRVDVYAVGVILYELLTGRVPFTADTFMGILTKHMFEAPPAPNTVRPDVVVPDQVEAIILKALQKDREYRFQSMPDLAAAIEAVGTDSAAVSVVAEQVALPSRGETRYSTTGAPLAPVGDTTPPKKKGGAGMLIGVAAFLLALGGAAGVYMLQGDKGDNGAKAATPTPTPEPKTETPEAKEVTPPPDTKVEPKEDDGANEEPPAPTEVAITVSTPDIAGNVVDAEGTVLGKTNEPFVLPIGTEALELTVQADGYADAPLSVTPSEEQTLEPTLTKLRRGGRKGGRRGGKGRGNKPNGGGTSTPSGDGGGTKPNGGGGTKPSGDGGGSKPSGGGGSPDLKDPFKKRG